MSFLFALLSLLPASFFTFEPDTDTSDDDDDDQFSRWTGHGHSHNGHFTWRGFGHWGDDDAHHESL